METVHPDFWTRGKDGVYRQTEAGSRMNHELHLRFDLVTGKEWKEPPKRESGCKWCYPYLWRWHRFVLRLRCNPRYALHVLLEKH